MTFMKQNDAFALMDGDGWIPVKKEEDRTGTDDGYREKQEKVVEMVSHHLTSLQRIDPPPPV